MIIGVDGNEANVKKRVGVSVYTLNLLNYFKKFSNSQNQFIIYLREKPLEDLPLPSKFFRYEIVSGRFLWSQIFLPLHLFKNKNINIFFSPAHYTPRFCPVPTIVAIHDLSYLYYPQEFLKKDLIQLTNWTKYSIINAKKIIAVSKTTKKDIVKNYGIAEDKISAIYNGFEKTAEKKTFLIKKQDRKTAKIKLKKYILFVGTIQPRKNIETLIDAFDKFTQTNKDFKLVVVGKKGWMYESIFEKIKLMKLGKKVIFTDHVSNSELIWFYKNAFCFVLPSLYEGFGIPILEAFNYSCPVISSFASSLPEIGDDACLYFDPQNTEELVEKLKLLHADENLRKELIKKGLKRVKNFSWQKCAEETLQLLTSVFNDKNNY